MTDHGYPQAYGIRRRRAVSTNHGDQERDTNAGYTDELRPPPLAMLRRAVRVPQQDLAIALGLGTSAVSKFERRELAQMQLGTLDAYVRGLGARLKIQVAFASVAIPLLGDGAPLTHAELWRLTLELR